MFSPLALHITTATPPPPLSLSRSRSGHSLTFSDLSIFLDDEDCSLCDVWEIHKYCVFAQIMITIRTEPKWLWANSTLILTRTKWMLKVLFTPAPRSRSWKKVVKFRWTYQCGQKFLVVLFTRWSLSTGKFLQVIICAWNFGHQDQMVTECMQGPHVAGWTVYFIWESWGSWFCCSVCCYFDTKPSLRTVCWPCVFFCWFVYRYRFLWLTLDGDTWPVSGFLVLHSSAHLSNKRLSDWQTNFLMRWI